MKNKARFSCHNHTEGSTVTDEHEHEPKGQHAQLAVEAADGSRKPIEEVLEAGEDLKVSGEGRLLVTIIQVGLATLEAAGAIRTGEVYGVDQEGEIVHDDGSTEHLH